MKSLTRAAVGVLALISLSLAQSSLPSCAVSCLGSALQNSTCSATDQACLCADVALKTQVSICVQSSCSIKEQLTTMNLTSITCSAPVRNKTKVYRNVGIIFYTLSTVSIALRFIARLTIGFSIGYDDWIIVLILFLNTVMEAFGAAGLVHHGLGQDIWKVPFDSITKILAFFWVGELIYVMEISLIKIAFLVFYLRLFPDRTFRRILWTLIFVNGMTLIIFTVAVCLICRPLSYVWNQWDLEHVGHCGDVNSLAFANAGVCIILDICTLVLPIAPVWKLHLSLKKRIGVILMFSVGAFVTIVSILRLRSLVKFANTINPTWDYFEAGTWSIIELDVGIICACMPSFRILLIKIFPRLGSAHEPTNPPCNYARRESTKPAQAESSVVQLVEIRNVSEELNE
ncbi:hypothetical protein BKA61DRAFT_542829 [Leptodontidium sp. MPI-SDFR-AT-0119]|nr:hypothetical protein BKA61DRAFT_542829 [Leptodontidium sp. MPI-SDFR-AT-0119]